MKRNDPRVKWGMFEEHVDVKLYWYKRGQLKCNVCMEYLAIDEFYNNKRGRFGKGSTCKECSNIRSTVYAKKSRPYVNHHARRRNAIIKRWFLSLFSKPSCARCGYDELPSQLHFHHVMPEQKELPNFTTGTMVQQILELNKCVILCSKCHSSYHRGTWVAIWIKQQFGWTIGELPPSSSHKISFTLPFITSEDMFRPDITKF